MGLKMTPHCDAFDTTRKVERYRVVLLVDVMGKEERVWSHDVYLSPRGRIRFDKFVDRGRGPASGKPVDKPKGGTD